MLPSIVSHYPSTTRSGRSTILLTDGTAVAPSYRCESQSTNPHHTTRPWLSANRLQARTQRASSILILVSSRRQSPTTTLTPYADAVTATWARRNSLSFQTTNSALRANFCIDVQGIMKSQQLQSKGHTISTKWNRCSKSGMKSPSTRVQSKSGSLLMGINTFSLIHSADQESC